MKDDKKLVIQLYDYANKIQDFCSAIAILFCVITPIIWFFMDIADNNQLDTCFVIPVFVIFGIIVFVIGKLSYLNYSYKASVVRNLNEIKK